MAAGWGLVKQDNAESGTSVPYPGKIPDLRWLFGAASKSKARTELIVLITPRVSTSSQSRQVTDDYRQQMQLLKVEPLRARLR